MSDRDVYTRALLKTRVSLPATLQNKHYEDSILQKLRTRVEGVCGSDGFVRPRSVEVVGVSQGIVDMSSLNGRAVYNVSYTADVCNPAVGDVMTCRVENVNSYGVLAVNMSETRVLEVILQRDPVYFEHIESLDDLEPGDTVTVEVMCRQFKLGQKTITIVGKAVSKDHRPAAPVEDQDDAGDQESEFDEDDEPEAAEDAATEPPDEPEADPDVDEADDDADDASIVADSDADSVAESEVEDD
jgi:DNA-directed RNA polymerase subunit E'/Rpb7